MLAFEKKLYEERLIEPNHSIFPTTFFILPTFISSLVDLHIHLSFLLVAMFSQAFLALAVLALTEARFNQEQVPIPAIAAVTSGGGPGVAATIAGQAISDLLAAANPCAKLKRGDQIIAQLGTGADAVAAAKGMIAAEQNFNPFVVSIPVLCSDPTLPTTPILRGITPKIDPAVGGADVANSLSAKSLTSPFPANGMSVAQVLAAQGFTNFTTKDLAGNAGSASNSGGTQVKVAATSPQPCPPRQSSSLSTSISKFLAPTPTTMSTSIRCGSAAGSSPSGKLSCDRCNVLICTAQGKAVDPVITTTTTSGELNP